MRAAPENLLLFMATSGAADEHGNISCIRIYTALCSARDGRGSMRNVSDTAHDLGAECMFLKAMSWMDEV